VQRHIGPDEFCNGDRVTDGIHPDQSARPKARLFLATVTRADAVNEAFPFMSAAHIDVGLFRSNAFAGLPILRELGWDCMLPSPACGFQIYDCWPMRAKSTV